MPRSKIRLEVEIRAGECCGRRRQTKYYWDLTGSRSPAFSLVTSHVVFVLLAFSLLQVFLLKSDRSELTKLTKKRLLAELLPDGEKVAVYWGNHVGCYGKLRAPRGRTSPRAPKAPRRV